jgi:hypothetical protein
MVSHSDVFLLLSPPRSCSTLISRILWEDPDLGFFAMEPFDAVYHRGGPALSTPMSLQHVQPLADILQVRRTGTALLIKEITYQVDEHFPAFSRWSTRPILFAVRDPRLTISSRMSKLREGGFSSIFPPEESGWAALARQVRLCRSQGVQYVIVDGTLLRAFPAQLVPELFRAIGLQSEPALCWRPAGHVDFGIGAGQHDYFFDRALGSTSVEPPDRQVPELGSFPAEGGMRRHVAECLDIYAEITADDRYLRPDGIDQH